MENNTDKQLREWRIIPRSYQIADTGDYDGHYEITNGKIVLISKDDPEAQDAYFKPLIEALNGIENLYVEDYGVEYGRGFDDARKQSLSELEEAKKEIDQLRADKQYLQEAVDQWQAECGNVTKLFEAKDKEIERLKAALPDLWDTAERVGVDAYVRLRTPASVQADKQTTINKILNKQP